jgi:hypothetical protein
MTQLQKIISGGQTGADEGGLAAALELGLQTGGWMPWGYQTECGSRLDFIAKCKIRETSSSDYRARTLLNIHDSDATLLVGNLYEPGTHLTWVLCGNQRKPYYFLSYSEDAPFQPKPEQLLGFKQWLVRCNVVTLNVAGNRESRNRGIFSATREFLLQTLKED